MINDADVATLWQKAVDGEVVDEITAIRIQNLLIDWFNTYRSYFIRARAVGHEGLAEQAVASIAVPMVGSPSLHKYWEASRRMHDLAAPEFVNAVDAGLRVWTEVIDTDSA